MATEGTFGSPRVPLTVHDPATDSQGPPLAGSRMKSSLKWIGSTYWCRKSRNLISGPDTQAAARPNENEASEAVATTSFPTTTLIASARR